MRFTERLKPLVLASVLLCLTSAAYAQDFLVEATAYVKEHVYEWANDPILIDAIRTQNVANASLSAADIDAMDKTWRAEKASGDHLVIAEMLSRPASSFLQDQIARMGGSVTNAILMDAKGLNVGVSAVTTDLWQGDEAKFEQTFLIGPDSLHMSQFTLDQYTGVYRTWISFTLSDPDSHEPIGAMAVALNAKILCDQADTAFFSRLYAAIGRTFSGAGGGFRCDH